ncbi:transcription termination/antitermination NusG family protein [Bradyrhizobium sp. 4]|uniref:transcription termination/antitermination protein NusG n=1 Tax=unclassified Bradyrhizobium TaxID=2631580 RepID=UPI001FF80DEE|nr:MULTISPECIES: transcription termination/antitermination NusG family protein [unclassified Bradyrhizobium]MCK1402048.1 transcription termination/antitermination NusG family protein [Bradyrhizobium sp. 39]MCK1751232.1 transcription termination/antitermination NusG family protein [Bradyrhizobium sp. 135]UPJ38487.1 transcription termination/antitermination NusG family protein [Bradyrhizobium sp. 4]
MPHIDTSTWVKGTFVGYVDLVKPEPIATTGRELLWHVVITEPGREARAIDSIQQLGLNPYWPHLHKRTPGGRRRSREIEVSMFPSRILVPMPQTVEAWHRIRSARGVVDFMMQSGSHKLATLPEMVVRLVREVEEKKDAKYRNLLMRAKKTPYYSGRDVWVEILPLRKMLGKIVDLDSQGRINVLTEVEILGRQIWPLKPHLVQFVEQ